MADMARSQNLFSFMRMVTSLNGTLKKPLRDVMLSNVNSGEAPWPHSKKIQDVLDEEWHQAPKQSGPKADSRRAIPPMEAVVPYRKVDKIRFLTATDQEHF